MSAALQYVRLVALAWSLSHSPAAVLVAADAMAATGDAWEQRWAIVWSFHESRWRTDAVDPTGSTRGCMQTAAMWGSNPPDRAGQFAQAIGILDVLVAQCGTRIQALQAYAGGACLRRVQLVFDRCRTIEGCDL